MGKSEQYNVIKFIGMILVVLGHSSNMYTDWGSNASFKQILIFIAFSKIHI